MQIKRPTPRLRRLPAEMPALRFMNDMKLKSVIFPLLFVLIFAFSNRAQEIAFDPDVPNLKKINDFLYRGGKPTAEGMLKLARMGVKTVINLRNDGSDRDEEAEWAKKANLNFFTVPLNIWFRPKDSQMKKILAIIEAAANQPVYVHCRLGADRSGMVVAVYRITHDGWTAKEANDEAKANGLGKWQIRMRDYINDVYRDFRKK
ncbi:MAG: dual specificity protein phosphatase family protein [Acidobacteria bacterium]|nr:dual specificity protein phosphatase family protein [Acidobacteriota bacterium]